ncbi:UNVERIFIED_CONTAM: hypothetical protein FKN15_031444 [Acipenser sinensis]
MQSCGHSLSGSCVRMSDLSEEMVAELLSLEKRNLIKNPHGAGSGMDSDDNPLLLQSDWLEEDVNSVPSDPAEVYCDQSSRGCLHRGQDCGLWSAVGWVFTNPWLSSLVLAVGCLLPCAVTALMFLYYPPLDIDLSYNAFEVRGHASSEHFDALTLALNSQLASWGCSRQDADDYATQTVQDHLQQHIQRQGQGGCLDHVKVLYGGTELFDYEVRRTFHNEMLLAFISGACIALLVYILTSFSVFLSFFGIASIGLSCLVALFLYHVVFGVRYLGILNGVSAFVIIGIGVDDVFVFINTFRQAVHLRDPRDRMIHTVHTAGKVTFFTSFTTAAAHAASTFSQDHSHTQTSPAQRPQDHAHLPYLDDDIPLLSVEEEPGLFQEKPHPLHDNIRTCPSDKRKRNQSRLVPPGVTPDPLLTVYVSKLDANASPSVYRFSLNTSVPLPWKPLTSGKGEVPSFQPAVRPLVDTGAMVFVVFGILGLNRTRRVENHVIGDMGNVIYDENFDLFKEIGSLCKLCKVIGNNAALVKPGGAQCLPSDSCLTQTTYKGKTSFQTHSDYLQWESFLQQQLDLLPQISSLQHGFQTCEHWKQIFMEILGEAECGASLLICSPPLLHHTSFHPSSPPSLLTSSPPPHIPPSLFTSTTPPPLLPSTTHHSFFLTSTIPPPSSPPPHHHTSLHLSSSPPPHLHTSSHPPHLHTPSLLTSTTPPHLLPSTTPPSLLTSAIVSSAVTTIIATVPLFFCIIAPFAKFGKIMALSTGISVLHTLTVCTTLLSTLGPAHFSRTHAAVLKALSAVLVTAGTGLAVGWTLGKLGVKIPFPTAADG